MKIIAVIPAWNEAKTIGNVVTAVLGYGAIPIVVDDGSTDDTSTVARAAGAPVIRHVMNRGLGAALGTGIAAALHSDADILFTFDGDGQHAAEDIPAVLAPLLRGEADVVIGSRFSGKGHMPFTRRMANRVGNLVTAILFGISVTDSQSGFRGFTRAAAERLRIRADGMEVSSEIIAEIHEHRLRVQEVPVTAVYTAYSLSKGQGFFMGLKTLAKLFLHWMTG